MVTVSPVGGRADGRADGRAEGPMFMGWPGQ